MIRRLLLALALIGAAPHAVPAQAVGPPRPVAGPTYVLYGGALYERYPNGWANVYEAVNGRWVRVDVIWWPY